MDVKPKFRLGVRVVNKEPLNTFKSSIGPYLIQTSNNTTDAEPGISFPINTEFEIIGVIVVVRGQPVYKVRVVETGVIVELVLEKLLTYSTSLGRALYE